MIIRLISTQTFAVLWDWNCGFFGLFYEAGGEAIDAAGIFLEAVVAEGGFAFDLGPAGELVAFADVLEEGDVRAAGGLDEVDLEEDHLACAGDFGVVEVRGEEGGVFVAGARQDAGVAVEAEDHGESFEGAEHEGEAVVEEEVRGGLVAAAGAVDIDDSVGVEDAEGGDVAGGDVDASFRRGGGVEEDLLALDELAVAGFDGLELLAYDVHLFCL